MSWKKLMGVFTVIALAATILLPFGFGTDAFAGRGRGGGWGWCGGSDAEPDGMYDRSGGYGPGYRYGGRSTLTEEQAKALEVERQAFFEATDDIRDSLRQKQFALRSEMAKKDVDVEAAKKLQGEISDLEAQLAEKRIEHMVKIREIDPDGAGRSFGKRGKGSRGARGQNGPGGNWN